MTVLGIKSETRDVDFIVSGGPPLQFNSIFEKNNNIHIDAIWSERIIIPSDYIWLAIDFDSFKNIDACAVCPEDIVITKAARLLPRDKDDIMTCTQYGVMSDQIIKRYKDYPFNKILHRNLGKALNTIFKISWDEYEKFNAIHY